MDRWCAMRRVVDRARKVVVDLGQRWRRPRRATSMEGDQPKENNGRTGAAVLTSSGGTSAARPAVEITEAPRFFCGLPATLPPMRKPRTVFRFVAVPRGMVKGAPGTVCFIYRKKLRCGDVIKGRNGRFYVILQRDPVTESPATVAA